MFGKFTFKDYIERGLESIGFKEPTKIQDIVISKALNNENIIGKSKTGTGKTHAFILPILERLSPAEAIDAVIISPTRELALQIYDEFNKIIEHSVEKIDIRLYVGGTNRDTEIERLKKSQPQIVIGTIGKIKDLAIKSNVLKIHTARMVVIDEADMVFEMSEMEEVDKVFARFINPQIMTFSATIPQNLMVFLNKYLSKNEVIDLVGKDNSKESINHIFIPTKNKNKDELLVTLLNTFHPYLALIFANTKTKVDELGVMLSENGFKVGKITGDLEARERKQVIKRIKDGEYQYVVASDIAARGIDITGVSHVINYELPKDVEFYIHRIGRTARFDATGMAISFYDYEDDNYIKLLKQKGLTCTYMNLRDGELKPTKERNVTFRKTSKFEAEVHKQIPLSKKVKPGYKKKRKEQIQKEARKNKRAFINEVYKRKRKAVYEREN